MEKYYDHDSFTIYFIISCQENIYLDKKNIRLSPSSSINIQKDDFITIKKGNTYSIDLPNKDILNGKNIYLYVATINLLDNIKEFNIKLNYFYGTNFNSKNPFPIKQKKKHYFIYEISFKLDKWFKLMIEKIIQDFIDDKFRISYLQKFMIFKEYIKKQNFNYFDELLESTANVLSNSKKLIDYEFILNFLIELINKESNYSNISEIRKRLFESVLSNFIDIKKITINNYNNNTYNDIIIILKNFKRNFKNNKNMILNIDLFNLLFYQINNRKEFLKLFKSIHNKNEATQYIIKHPALFKNYDSSILQLIYGNAKEEQIGLILSLSLNFNEYIKFYCFNLNKISNKKLYKYIDFKKCPLPDENFDPKYLIQFIESIIENDEIYFPNDQFIELLKQLNSKDYKKLIQLKSIFINFIEYKSNWKVKDILKKLDEIIHITGKKFIEDDKLNNLEIITFIHDDALIFYDDYSKNCEYPRLISHINLDKIDNEFIRKFIDNDYDYKKLMKNNYKIFIQSIIYQAKSFKNLKSLYKIFNIEKKNEGNEENEEIISQILDLLNNKTLNKDKDISNLELSKILETLFRLVKNSNLDKLIKVIKKKFSYNDFNEIITNILNDSWNMLSDDKKNKLIHTICNNNEFLSNKNIIITLNNFNNLDLQKYFLEKQKKNIIIEEELFNINFSDELKFIFDLIQYGFFDEIFNDVKYIKKTREFMNDQIIKLKKFYFFWDRLQILLKLDKQQKNEEDNLKKLLFIISLGDKSKVNSLYKSLANKISECYEILEKLKIITNIFDSYYSQEEYDTLIKYKQIIEEIKQNQINKFPNKNNILDFDSKFEKAYQIYKLKKSKIFIEIFEYIKMKEDKNNNSLIVNKTINYFKKLKDLFDQKTEGNVNINELEEILKKINYEEIDNEINKIRKILNINKTSNNNVFFKLKLLKNKNKNYEILKKINLLLNEFNLKQKEIKNTLEKSIEALNDIKSLQQLIDIDQELNSLNLKILNSDKNQKYLIIIDKMYEKPELINFLKDKTIYDIHQMCEFIDDSEDVYITLGDISYLEECKKFIEKLNVSNFSEKTFLNNFMKVVDLKDYKDIEIKFENSTSKYQDFHELYTNHLNPNELNKHHIKAIYDSSSFILNPSYPIYECKANYRINNKNYIKDFDDILDLRDVALLRKKDQKEEIYFKICENFANIINEIQEVLKILNIISSKGHYEKLMFEIIIKNGNCVGYRNNSDDGRNLKEIIIELKNIKEDQYKIVKDIYTLNPITRLIYGKQFEFIYNFLMKNIELDSSTYNILKYVTNNNNNKKPINIKKVNKENKIHEMFENVNLYLKDLHYLNSINLENIYKNSILLQKNTKGLYSHSCKLEEIEKNVIYCSLSLTGNFPIAQTVLYCNSSTSEEEITAFIYKSIKCEFNALFIIIKPEILDIEKKELLIQLLKDIYSKQSLQMNSCLLFVYSEDKKKKEVIQEIEKLPEHKYYSYDKNKINNKYYNNINIEIYLSEFSGLGKSTLIKNDFKNYIDKYNYEYTYFPIGDDINRNELINRLLKLSNKKIALHLDLNDLYNIKIIREFLFSFLILKFYSQKENIFFYGNEIMIKIEIPNSFINFLDIFPILSFFKIKHITPKEMPQLIVSKEISSNIQIVCNYLKYINQINEKDIYFKNLSNNSYPNCIIAQPINQIECSKLIFENINIKNPNFYQIISFINLISEQLKLFTNSYYLNTSILNEIKNFKKNLDNIRFFFVYSLTLITKYFIISSYDNILKGQEITYSQQKGKTDIEKAKEKSREILLQKEPFSIEKIRPSMIFINEDGQSISEIITCKKNTEEYNLLKAIYNSDLQDESRGVLDYSQLTSKEFLIEVKKVLDLVNPIDDFDKLSPKTKGGKPLKTLEKIVESYVFTADNFIKLILISLRLRTNIPVIMMGETGCGKTSLIRIIATLKDIKMHIFNIHAGIEDKDIIKFLDDKNLFEKNNENNELTWVFLDEINTCNSLSLITEIMLKNSCKGEKIRKNVKFIAACNPYRLFTKENEIIGLYDETKYTIRKLVYNVNPLPIPLLNFVFDFGTLNKVDIKRYITNIFLQILKNTINNEKQKDVIMKIAINAIFDSQEFIKNNFEISSVSLRESGDWVFYLNGFIIIY